MYFCPPPLFSTHDDDDNDDKWKQTKSNSSGSWFKSLLCFHNISMISQTPQSPPSSHPTPTAIQLLHKLFILLASVLRLAIDVQPRASRPVIFHYTPSGLVSHSRPAAPDENYLYRTRIGGGGGVDEHRRLWSDQMGIEGPGESLHLLDCLLVEIYRDTEEIGASADHTQRRTSSI